MGIGEPLEDLGKDRAVGLVQAAKQVLTVGLRGTANGAQPLFALAGEVQSVVAPVLRVAAALQQRRAFELIDQSDQPARREAELRRQCLLRAAGAGRDRAQQPGLRRRHTEWDEPLSEALRRQPSELREQERRLPGRHRVRSCCHTKRLSSATVYGMNGYMSDGSSLRANGGEAMAEQHAGTRQHPRRPAEAGPPLAPVVGVSAALFLAGIVVPLVVASGEPYPAPMTGGDKNALPAYLAAHANALRLGAFFQFASSVPLAVFTAAAVGRLHALGVRAAGPTIGLAGGLLGSVALAVSACAQWVLSRLFPDAPEALLGGLRDLAFVTGGPWHVVGLGLLLAGIAVSSAFHRLLPRPVWVTGVALAVICELTTLTLALPSAAYLIPLGRFGGLAWLIVVALLLPIRRPHRAAGPVDPAPVDPTPGAIGRAAAR